MTPITTDALRQWIGSDSLTIDHTLQLLCELLNGQYSIDAMRSDVADYGSEES